MSCPKLKECYCGKYCGGKNLTGLFGPPPPLPEHRRCCIKRRPICKYPPHLGTCLAPNRASCARCCPVAIMCPAGPKCISKCRTARLDPCCLLPRPVPFIPPFLQNFVVYAPPPEPCPPIDLCPVPPPCEPITVNLKCSPPPPPQKSCSH